MARINIYTYVKRMYIKQFYIKNVQQIKIGNTVLEF